MNVSHVESMLPTTVRNMKQLAVGFVMKCGTTQIKKKSFS